MGTYEKGILGEFNGKVGNVVGSNWKGISYMRAKSKTTTSKSSEKQIIQRAKFQYVSNFIQPLQPVIQVGYKSQEVHKTPRNAAMSEILNYTLMGEYPAFSINFAQLKIAKGSLDLPPEYAIALQDNRVVYTWSIEGNSEDGEADSTWTKYLLQNNVILLTLADGYAPKYTMYKYKRSDGTGDLGLPNAPSGTVVHCYLAFFANDGSNKVSNSVHVGTVTMP